MIITVTISTSDGEVVVHIISKIKNGDNQLREKFIKDYIPFVLRVISSSIAEKNNLKNKDEYSIGLIAFNEAIEKYDNNKSKNSFSFFNFAEQVIKRRLIDYKRFISKVKTEIPFSYLCEDENSFEEKYLNDPSQSKFDRIELFQEIKHFSKVLDTFGIRINELHKYTPRHRDSREMCVNIARKIAENKEIYNKLVVKKYFPMKELSQIVNVHPRTIERNRKFIISVSLIYGNKYEHLQSYLRDTVNGGGTDAL
ncbi:MAG TPA: sigma-70 family RNA polymerase sigma factor [Clostridia bacterium]